MLFMVESCGVDIQPWETRGSKPSASWLLKWTECSPFSRKASVEPAKSDAVIYVSPITDCVQVSMPNANCSKTTAHLWLNGSISFSFLKQPDQAFNHHAINDLHSKHLQVAVLFLSDTASSQQSFRPLLHNWFEWSLLLHPALFWPVSNPLGFPSSVSFFCSHTDLHGEDFSQHLHREDSTLPWDKIHHGWTVHHSTNRTFQQQVHNCSSVSVQVWKFWLQWKWCLSLEEICCFLQFLFALTNEQQVTSSWTLNHHH